MTNINTGTLSFLDNSSSQVVLKVLSDINGSINCPWALCGSISYRIQVPHIQTKPGLRDIDIVIYPQPGQNPKYLVDKNIHKKFYVMDIDHLGRGYYFRVVHKATKTHVDLFTAFHTTENTQVMLEDMTVNVQSLEDTAFAMLKDLLWRNSKEKPIRQKWLDNATNLWQVVNQEKTLSFFREYRAEYDSYLPDSLKGIDATYIVEYLLSLQATYCHHGYLYPIDCITTLNGISIEDEETLRYILGAERKISAIKWHWVKWKNILFSKRTAAKK